MPSVALAGRYIFNIMAAVDYGQMERVGAGAVLHIDIIESVYA
jgi:hypothetical protein